MYFINVYYKLNCTLSVVTNLVFLVQNVDLFFKSLGS